MFSLSVLIAGFGVFWASPIIVLVLGESYAPAGFVFVLTLLNSVFQCFNIIPSSMFLATRRTQAWSKFQVAFVLASLLGSVIVLLGLRLGAAGLAAKLLLLSIVFSTAYDLYICRLYGWKTDNYFRIAVGLGVFATGLASYLAVRWLLGDAALLVQIAAAGVLYGLIAGVGGFFLARRLGYWRHLLAFLATRRAAATAANSEAVPPVPPGMPPL